MADDAYAQEPGWGRVPEGWGLAHTEDGHAYCYNPETGESFWLEELGERPASRGLEGAPALILLFARSGCG